VAHPDLGDLALSCPLSSELRHRLRAEVSPPEKVCWVGRPRAFRLIVNFIPVILGGFGVLAFPGFIAAFMSTMPAPQMPGRGWNSMPFFLVVCLPALAVSLICFATPMWAFAEQKRTLYTVTDRRLIVSRPTWTGSIRTKSFLADDIGPLERFERPDGSGDLLFGLAVEFRRKNGVNDVGRLGFFGIAQVGEVESLIRATLLADGWAGRPAGMRVNRTISGGQP